LAVSNAPQHISELLEFIVKRMRAAGPEAVDL
jgi:hypothetical protein